VIVDNDTCVGCGFCVRDCPVSAVKLVRKKAVIEAGACINCRVCLRVCPEDAISLEQAMPENALECDACPIKCWIQPDATGACLRYVHSGGKIERITPHHTYEDVREAVGAHPANHIREPLITAIGAGTSYPCCKPAPGIVSDRRDEVDVVTVVTEVPLSYSSVLVKVDTDVFIGSEGAAIFIGKRQVGMVETEQYGSKMLHIGGVNRLTGEHGFAVARAITDIANRKPVKIKIENGSRLTIQVGRPPLIDGKEVQKMRVGCGSATLGIFAPQLKEAADEVVVLDSHVTGLLSRHVAGEYAGVKPTGVEITFKESTPGRYFGDHGDGWGGTSITDPSQIIKSVNMDIAWPGMTILVTETTGQNGAMFEVGGKGQLRPVSLSEEAQKILRVIEESCEPSLVSAIYTAGTGGSARAGVSRYPIKLTRAIHAGKANLTVGGAPTFVMPGGGISFMVDVERVKAGSFYWTPTPATICPVEYTMEKEEYERIGGHVEAIKPFKPNPR
jgi:Pyruvate/2-oxoacid:ferredoxin oxidoreductase delta subunit